nr:hypothetical protein [Tanacetum cinerariifolium]
MAFLVIIRIVLSTITMLSNLISYLLLKIITYLLVYLLKVPGETLVCAMQQITCLIKCCIENLLVFILKIIFDAACKIIGFFFNLVGDVIFGLVVAIMRGVTSTSDQLKQTMVKTAVDMIKVCFDYLIKSFREFILDEIFKIPGLLVGHLLEAVFGLFGKITLAFDDLMKSMKLMFQGVSDVVWESVVKMMRDYLDYLLKSIPERLYGHLVEAVFGLCEKMAFASNELMEAIKLMFEGVLESLVTMMIDYLAYLVESSPEFTWETITKFVGLLSSHLVEAFGSFRNMTSSFDDLMKFITPMFEGSFKGVLESVTLESISKIVGLLCAHFVDAVFGTSGKMMSAINEMMKVVNLMFEGVSEGVVKIIKDYLVYLLESLTGLTLETISSIAGVSFNRVIGLVFESAVKMASAYDELMVLVAKGVLQGLLETIATMVMDLWNNIMNALS